jgi:hypothetical protein
MKKRGYQNASVFQRSKSMGTQSANWWQLSEAFFDSLPGFANDQYH